MSIFNLPDLGEGLPDAEISKWYVKEGETVELDQPIVAMETAKAVVDVPAPQSGKIEKLYGKPGDIIKTGSPLIEFSGGKNSAASTDKATSGNETHAVKDKTETRADSGTVAGKIEVGETIITESATGVTQVVSNTHAIKAMPAVRAFAKKQGIDLALVKASGQGGQITLDDVKKFTEHGNTSATATRSAAAVMTTAQHGVDVDPLRGVRRAMANAMTKAHAEVAPVTLVDDANIHAWPKGTDITYRVIRAIISGVKAEPGLNSHFDFAKLERKIFHGIHLGMAMDSKEGLFVPVIKNVEAKSQAEIRSTINRFKKEVADRSVAQDELQGSTIQVSNFGTFAGRYANPVIVPPIVAIIGTGKIREEVVAHDGMIAIHRMMPLSITVDHRAVTGGEAARFLQAVIQDLEKAG